MEWNTGAGWIEVCVSGYKSFPDGANSDTLDNLSDSQYFLYDIGLCFK